MTGVSNRLLLLLVPASIGGSKGSFEKLPGWIQSLTTAFDLLLGTMDAKYLEQHPVYARPNGVVPSTTATHNSSSNPPSLLPSDDVD